MTIYGLPDTIYLLNGTVSKSAAKDKVAIFAVVPDFNTPGNVHPIVPVQQ